MNGASLAKIERVENPQSPALPMDVSRSQSASTNNSTIAASKICSTQRVSNASESCNGEVVLPGSDLKPNSDSKKQRVEEDNDSAMDTSEPGPLSHDSSKSNGSKENGQASPSDTLNSPPPLCNGNVSDTDSLLTEPTKAHHHLLNGVTGKEAESRGVFDKRMVSGGGDAEPTIPPLKNGFLNGLEKMIANIPGSEKHKPHKNLTGASSTCFMCVG